MVVRIQQPRFYVRDLEERDYDFFSGLLSESMVLNAIGLKAKIGDCRYFFDDAIAEKRHPIEERTIDSLVIELSQQDAGPLSVVEIASADNGCYSLGLYIQPFFMRRIYPVSDSIRAIVSEISSRDRQVQIFLPTSPRGNPQSRLRKIVENASLKFEENTPQGDRFVSL